MQAKKKAAEMLTEKDELRIYRHLADITSEETDLSSLCAEIVTTIREATRADVVSLYLHDHTEQVLMLAAASASEPKAGRTVPEDCGLSGEAVRDRQVIALTRNAAGDKRITDCDLLGNDECQAFLCVPVLFRNTAIGVINLQHNSPRKYTKNLISMITTIGKQAAGIISNARMAEETRRKAMQFDSVVKVSRSITSEQYLDEILNLAVVVTSEMFDSKICSIMLLDEKNGNIMIKATNALSDDYKNKPPLKIDSSLSGEVLKKQIPRAVLDVRKEDKYVFRDLAVKENLSSMLLIPMIFQKQSIGLINVYTKDTHHFTPQEMDVLQIIANQAAVAIKNTKLMEETLKIREALETRKVIDRAKGILMKMTSIGEDEAYKLIKKKSMDSCRSMREIAEAIIITSDLGGAQGRK